MFPNNGGQWLSIVNKDWGRQVSPFVCCVRNIQGWFVYLQISGEKSWKVKPERCSARIAPLPPSPITSPLSPAPVAGSSSSEETYFLCVDKLRQWMMGEFRKLDREGEGEIAWLRKVAAIGKRWLRHACGRCTREPGGAGGDISVECPFFTNGGHSCCPFHS